MEASPDHPDTSLSCGRQGLGRALGWLLLIVVGLGVHVPGECSAATTEARDSAAAPARDSQGGIRLTGRLLSTSELPDPETNAYPDCVMVTRVAVVELLAGDGVPNEILVAFWGFRDGVYAPAASFEAGDTLTLSLVPYEQSDPGRRGIEMADDTDEYELPLFFARDAAEAAVPSEAESPTKAEAGPGRESAGAPEPTPRDRDVTSTQAHIARAEAMAADTARIRSLLARRDGSWKRWYRELAPLRAELKDRCNPADAPHLSGNHYFQALRYLRYRLDRDPAWPDRAVAALSELNVWLRDRGVDLIVVPVPPKELVTYTEFVEEVPTDLVVQPYRLKLFLALLQSDVEVVDLVPHFIRRRNDYEYLYYPNSDQHPADGAIQISADVLAPRLMRYLQAPVPARHLRPRSSTATIPQHFLKRPLLCPYPENFEVVATQVVDAGGSPIRRPAGSRFLIIGDSFAVATKHRGIEAADIWAHLALRLSVTPSVLARAGASGAPMAPITLRRRGDDYLDGVRACVLFFNEEYLVFHDEAWKIVPSEPPSPAATATSSVRTPPPAPE